MFCPNCELEYRPGFTHCNDCDVDLVEELPGKDEAGEAEEELVEPQLLWRGADGGLFTELTLELEAAGIRFNREKLDARMTFTADHMLEIWVPGAELAAAEKLRDEVLASIREATELNAARAAAEAAASVAGGSEDDDGDLPPVDSYVEEPHPEDATAEVWTGKEETVALFLKSALTTNAIGSCVEENEAGGFALRVLPEDEERSREIVRQVVEGATPE
jgi:hypothetical protein